MVEVDPNEEGQKCHPDTNPTELEVKINRQLLYYFGDINLSKDKFLQEQIKLEDGWVPFETMLKFNRLAQLSSDESTIVKAVKKCKSKLLEVSEDSKKIRRSPSVPIEEMNDDKRKELMKRTLYMKGFDKEETKLAELLEFFPKYGSVDNVVLRNYQDKATKTWHFKGSIFVVFGSVEDAEKVLNMDEMKFKDCSIVRKWQLDYLEEKRQERLELQKGRKNKSEKKPKEDQAAEGEPAFEEGFEPGRVVRLTQISGNVSREDIKKTIEDMGIAVVYTDFSRGDSEATVRLDEKDSAEELVNKVKEECHGKLTVNGCEMEIAVLGGEEELQYLEKAKELRNSKRNVGKHNKRKGRGGYRGGRGGYRKNDRGGGNRKRPGSPTNNVAAKKSHGDD